MAYDYNGVAITTGNEIEIKGRFWDGIDRPEYVHIIIGGYKRVDTLIKELQILSKEAKHKDKESIEARRTKLKVTIENTNKELERLEDEYRQLTDEDLLYE